MAGDQEALGLQQRLSVKNNIQRASDLVILFLLLSLLCYRLASFRRGGIVWIVAFACEFWFAFVWALHTNAKWSPVEYETHPDRLLKRFEDLPAVDMFVTTADPNLEPPLVTVNTVLSLLAVEYPPRKLACYVSDDGGSPITYYALLQASKFAQLWVPFCKKYKIQVRAPFAYFSEKPKLTSPEFSKEWTIIKEEYEELSRRIERAGEKYVPYHMNKELADFSGTERANHPSIIKVIWENKENSEDSDIPHLVYVSREKRPKHPHHYKAGAMNVLTRVSGVMTNAPFMLNVDCDMFVNNPDVILHAMCLLLGFEDEAASGFVQCPQEFHGSLKDDPFGNQLVVLQKKVGAGIGGIQGPFYGGTGCFHRRKIIYGAAPEQIANPTKTAGNDDAFSKMIFGDSKELMDSVADTLSGRIKEVETLKDLSSRIEVAKQVAACTFEFNTSWGDKIGWAYGAVTEDVLTGLRIHAAGWNSVYLTPEPCGFLGNAPTGGPASLTQMKRWATGLFEMLFSRKGPVDAVVTKRLMFRQFLSYMVINIWALRSIPELVYTMLPAYCLFANTSFLPKASEVGIWIPVSLFLAYNASTLREYLECGLSLRSWWNNLRMQRIYAITVYPLGLFSVVLKLSGFSQTIFEVTRKDQQQKSNNKEAETEEEEEEPGRFTFDTSPLFVSGTAVVIAHAAAVGVDLLRAAAGRRGGGAGTGELVCSVWVLLNFWPFVRGLFGKGSYGIPWPTIWKAVVLVAIFLQFCSWSAN